MQDTDLQTGSQTLIELDWFPHRLVQIEVPLLSRTLGQCQIEVCRPLATFLAPHSRGFLRGVILTTMCHCCIRANGMQPAGCRSS